jgi:predicted regulator of Ras-like GTPase activity (Roadblock/LC7/MglB family)
MRSNRRRHRSDDAAQALTLFLGAEARRRGLRAIAVGTSDGLPIAAWGAVDAEELAAIGSLHACGEVAAARRELPDLSSVTVVLLEHTLVVSSCGGKAPRRADVADHIQRIMRC